MKPTNSHKIILIDTNVLIALINVNTAPDDAIRLKHFLEMAEKTKAKIIIPMPALAEFLIRVDPAAIEVLTKLEGRSYIVLAPFDRVSAFECANLERAAHGGGDKKDGEDQPWQKIKIDRQNVAIGKAQGATLVITEDKSVRNNALRLGLHACSISELEYPTSARQTKLAIVSTDSPANNQHNSKRTHR